MKENAEKARALDGQEINKQLREGAEQAFRIRFQMSMGQVEGIKKLRSLRKERARMLTILREREIAGTSAPVKAPAKAGKKTAAPVAKPKAAKSVEPKAAAKAPVVKKAAVKKVAAKTSEKAKGKG